MLPIASKHGRIHTYNEQMELHEPTREDEQMALDELSRHMGAIKARRNALSDDELRRALDTITDALRHHWSTGGGTRVRRFIWSLWNDWHLVNLFDLCAGLDHYLGDAVIVIFRAQLIGALSEEHKRRVLKDSGEFSRWEDARRRRRRRRMFSTRRFRSGPTT